MTGPGPPDGALPPNPARMWDRYLGDAHHLAADRAAADRVLAVAPHLAATARAVRAFRALAVRRALAEGIDRFLDLGCGYAAADTEDEVRAARPDARVVHVDGDPVVVARCREPRLRGAALSVVHADPRRPWEVLRCTDVRELVGSGERLAVLVVGALDFVADRDRPAAIVADYRAACAPGSVLALTHLSDEDEATGAPDPRMRAAADLYRGYGCPLHLRSRADIGALVARLDLLPPGVVDVRRWLSDTPSPDFSGCYAAMGRVPS